ncbi:hypothetical protein ABGT15_01170 [Flavobacterium enshiense]|uniref:hypothetical protein n=1 Tax=Flavobacterium enshiense TaxID=1341165 RepID=UPI00345CCDD9
MKQKLLLLFCFLTTVCNAQQIKVLQGRVLADTKELGGITIRNLSLGRDASTKGDGTFSIAAKVGDTLFFTAIQLKPKTIVVEKEDFDYLPFPVRMELKVTELKEVVVEKSNIDAVSLGIVPYKVKKFTPAERRYYTATTGSGIVPIDPIINAITGRTAMLKKEIQIEKYKMVQAKLGNMFEAEYLIREFDIPEDYIEGFVFFVAEKPKVMDAVKAKNKTLTLFLLGELAVEYKTMLQDAK